MNTRRLTAALVMTVVLGGCTGTTSDQPDPEPVDSGPIAVLEKARNVANDLEQRQAQIDAQMPDPFSRP